MCQGEYPDIYLTRVYQLRDEFVHMGEIVSDEYVSDNAVEGLTYEYIQMKYNAERNPCLV